MDTSGYSMMNVCNFSLCMERLKCMVVVHVHGAWSRVHW